LLVADRNGYSLFLDTTGVRAELASASAAQLTTSQQISINVWTHLAVVWDSSTVKLYVNGTQVASAAQTVVPNNGVYPTNIGVDGRSPADATHHYGGLLDDVGIWTIALTPTQIAGLAAGTTDPSTLSPAGLWRFEEGSGTTTADGSGNGNTGTLTNGPTWSTDVPSQLQ
jgi:hypothetical protein